MSQSNVFGCQLGNKSGEFSMNKWRIILLLLTSWGWLAVSNVSLAVCTTSITGTAPDSRFTNNGDGTITDKATSLMWKRCAEGQMTTAVTCIPGTVGTYTWQEALQLAETLNSNGGFSGYTDWRLPNRNELASLVERKCADPAINQNIFPGTEPSDYWSSSPDAKDANRAWSVDFFYGKVVPQYKSANYGWSVRLVRDAN